MDTLRLLNNYTSTAAPHASLPLPSTTPPPLRRPLRPQHAHDVNERAFDVPRRRRRRLHEAEPECLCEPRPFGARDGAAVRPVGLVPDEHADGLVLGAGDDLDEGAEGFGFEGGARGGVVHQQIGLAFAAAKSVMRQACTRCVAHRAHKSRRVTYSPVK